MSLQEEEGRRERRTPRKNPQPVRKLRQSQVNILTGAEESYHEDGCEADIKQDPPYNDLVPVSNIKLAKLSQESCGKIRNVGDASSGISLCNQDGAHQGDEKEHSKDLIESTVEDAQVNKNPLATGESFKSSVHTRLIHVHGSGADKEVSELGEVGISCSVKSRIGNLGLNILHENEDYGQSMSVISNSNKPTSQVSSKNCGKKRGLTTTSLLQKVYKKAQQSSSLKQKSFVPKVRQIEKVEMVEKGSIVPCAKDKGIVLVPKQRTKHIKGHNIGSCGAGVLSIGVYKARKLAWQARKMRTKSVSRIVGNLNVVLEKNPGNGDNKDKTMELSTESAPPTTKEENHVGNSSLMQSMGKQSSGNVNKVEICLGHKLTEAFDMKAGLSNFEVSSSKSSVPVACMPNTSQESVAIQKDGFDPSSALAGLHRLTQELTDLGKDSATLGRDIQSNKRSEHSVNQASNDQKAKTLRKRPVQRADGKNIVCKTLKTPMKCSRKNPKRSSTKQKATMSPQKLLSLSPITLRYLHRSPPIITGRSMFKCSPRGPQGSSTPNTPVSRNYQSPRTPGEQSRKTLTKETVKRQLSQTPQKELQPSTSAEDSVEKPGKQIGTSRKSECKGERLMTEAKHKRPRRELAFGRTLEEKERADESGSSMGSDSECDDVDKLTILTDLDNDLDQALDSKSEANGIRLTAINVKNIIHQVITNEHVMDMVRNTLQEEGISDQLKEAIFEPKMTRSKVKEVLEKGDITQTLQLPHMWPISPIKVKKKTEPQFMQISFEEDEDDEEYKPGVDDSERDSEEDSESVLSSQASDLGSPPPSTPNTPNTPYTPRHGPKFLSDSEITPKTPDCNRTLTVVPMGPPPTPRELARVRNTLQFVIQSPDTSLPSLSFEEEEETIALRTRSKIPLTDTPLDEIESKLVAPDITPDMYDPYIDDQEWQDFLTSLTKDNAVELNDTKDDEENDPEYNFLAETEEVDHEDLREDLRNDRAVRVSRRELNELVDELFQAYACCESADTDVVLPAFQSHSTPNPIARPKAVATASPAKSKDKEKKEKEPKKKKVPTATLR